MREEAEERCLQWCSNLWEKLICPNLLVLLFSREDFLYLLWALQMCLASCLKELLPVI